MNLRLKIEEICYNIKLAQEKNNLQHPVEIVGVTKTKPFSFIQATYKAGLRAIGENRIQEAENKFGSFEKMPGLKKRFIGHLQSNKVKKCVELFDAIDSVSSLKTLKKIERYSQEMKKPLSVLIEINTSEETQKHGFLPTQKDEILQCFYHKGLAIDGLMTLGPNTSDQGRIRMSFKKLRKTKEWIESQTKIKINHLSMGMSGDYKLAVEEGSTMIRVGSFLYGPRN